MHVLLTGSSGWLGHHLAPMLARAGHEVTGLDLVDGPFTTVVGTLTDRKLVDRTMGEHGIEAVIHAGGLHQPDMAGYSRQAFIDVNVAGTLGLLEAAVAAGNDRFILTSTTSLMVRGDVGRGAGASGAWWMDEDFGPIEPRNIYGLSKHAAEEACRLIHHEHGIHVAMLRTSRFFRGHDDGSARSDELNIKANELLHRRLTVEDAAAAHLAALEEAPTIGCDMFIVSAPPPFTRDDAAELARDAPSVIARRFPDAAELFAAKGWRLPHTIDRVYDPSRAEARLGWRARTDFARLLDALRTDAALPFGHDPARPSPLEGQESAPCMC